MKKIILTSTLLLLFLGNIRAQNYVYRTNYNGEVEVYQSDNSGTIKGNPIGVCKKNYNGDYIYTANTMTNIYPPKRDLPQSQNQNNREIVPSFYPDFSYLNYSRTQNTSTSNSANETYSNILAEHTKSVEAEQKYLEGLFNRFINKPKKVMDGWHALKYFNETQSSTHEITKFSNNGFAKVLDNKIVQILTERLYSKNIWEVSDISYSSTISQCKALFKGNGEIGYSESYFVQNIVDSTNINLPSMYNISFAKSTSINGFISIFITDKPIDLSNIDSEAAADKLYASLSSNNLVDFDFLDKKEIEQMKIKPGSYYVYAIDIEHHIWSKTIEVFNDLPTITFNK